MKKQQHIFGIFLHKFPKKNIHIWIQQFYFGRKQEYLWKRFYTVKKPLNNRAIDRLPYITFMEGCQKVRPQVLSRFLEEVSRKASD